MVAKCTEVTLVLLAWQPMTWLPLFGVPMATDLLWMSGQADAFPVLLTSTTGHTAGAPR